MQSKGNFIQVPVSQPAHPFPPFPLYLDTLLLQSGLDNKKGSTETISVSFVTAVGAGVPSTYGSNVNAYCVLLRNLPIEEEGFDKSATSGCVYVTCPEKKGTLPIDVDPSSPDPTGNLCLPLPSCPALTP